MDDALRKMIEEAMPEEADKLLTERQQKIREHLKENAINTVTGERNMTDEEADRIIESMGGPEGMELLTDTGNAFMTVTDLATKGKDVAQAADLLIREVHDFMFHTDGTGDCDDGHDVDGIPPALLEAYTITQLKIRTLRDMWEKAYVKMEQTTEEHKETMEELNKMLSERGVTLQDILDRILGDDVPES